jgi:hypothetical protein
VSHHRIVSLFQLRRSMDGASHPSSPSVCRFRGIPDQRSCYRSHRTPPPSHCRSHRTSESRHHHDRLCGEPPTQCPPPSSFRCCIALFMWSLLCKTNPSASLSPPSITVPTTHHHCWWAASPCHPSSSVRARAQDLAALVRHEPGPLYAGLGSGLRQSGQVPLLAWASRLR